MRTVVLIGMVVVAFAVAVGCTTTGTGAEQASAQPQAETRYCIETQSYLPANDPHFQKPATETKPAAPAAPKTGEAAPKSGTATQ